MRKPTNDQEGMMAADVLPHLPGTPEEVKAFWDAYLPWQQLWNELSERGVEYEDRKVAVANIRTRWLSRFGSEKIAVEEAFQHLTEYQQLLDLLDRDPSLTKEQLQAAALRFRDTTESALRPLYRDVLLARESKLCPDRWYEFDDAQWAAAQARKKRVFRESWRLVHPDQLEHNPRYKNLTEKQKKLLREFQFSLSAVRTAHETGFSPEQLGFEFRSPASMEHVLHMIKQILGNHGHEIDFERAIPGETIAEQTVWLLEDQERLSRGIEELDKALIALLSDDVYQEQRWQVACPEQEATIREHLQDQAASYEQRAEQLRKELSKALGEEWDIDCGHEQTA